MSKMLPLPAAIASIAVLAAAGCADREEARRREAQTRADIRMITPAAEKLRREMPDKCLTAGELRSRGELPPDANIADPWGRSYYVTCTGPRIRVTSAGPDGVQGNADDIHEP
jgi:hypothetical protein